MLAVLLGQFVILNLIIAVLGESYEDAVQDAAREAQERKLEKKRQRAKLKMTKSQKIGQKQPDFKTLARLERLEPGCQIFNSLALAALLLIQQH